MTVRGVLALGLLVGWLVGCAASGATPGAAPNRGAAGGTAPAAGPGAAGSPLGAVEPPSAGTTSQAPEKIVLALASVTGVFAPHVLAQQKGFFREAGLDVEVAVLRPNLLTAGLTSGEVAYTGSFGTAVRDAVAGMPIRVIAGTVDKSTRLVMAQPGITSMAQLRGAGIAVSTIGSGPYNSGVLALQAFGIDPHSEVTWVPAGTPSERVLAVQGGAALASVFSASELPRAESLGLVPLLRLNDVAPLPESGLTVSPDRLAGQPDQVKRMLRAIVRSLQYLKSDREGSIPVFMDYLKMSYEDAGPAYDAMAWAFSDDGTVSDQALRFSIDAEKQVLQTAEDIPPRRVADFGPLYEVLREQGITPGPDRAR
jgi:NitT/TauT family transport system substrate-binding protein